MTPIQIERLQAAWNFAAEQKRLGINGGKIIAALVERHGAVHRPRWDASTLRCAGVSSSCTWSSTDGLLGNWLKTAGLRLIEAAFDRQNDGRPA